VLLIGMGGRLELWDKTRHEAHEATVLAAGLTDPMRDLVL
jgi:DNA-binding transcriptional regulator/RsmH inhibitor MraZ